MISLELYCYLNEAKTTFWRGINLSEKTPDKLTQNERKQESFNYFWVSDFHTVTFVIMWNIFSLNRVVQSDNCKEPVLSTDPQTWDKGHQDCQTIELNNFLLLDNQSKYLSTRLIIWCFPSILAFLSFLEIGQFCDILKTEYFTLYHKTAVIVAHMIKKNRSSTYVHKYKI